MLCVMGAEEAELSSLDVCAEQRWGKGIGLSNLRVFNKATGRSCVKSVEFPLDTNLTAIRPVTLCDLGLGTIMGPCCLNADSAHCH